MPSWPAKDPEAVLDYVFRIPLDAGDSVTALSDLSFSRLSGTVAIDSQSLAAAPNTTSEGYGQDLTVWLSGGADGETDVFKAEWTTAQGRTPDPAIVTLLVQKSDIPALASTGYAKPLPGHLAMRYPAFASVPASTVQYWLTDAERYVDRSWNEGDYAPALMALAAHNMALAGLGTDAAAAASTPAGVTAMKSGSLSLDFTKEAANARLTGDFSGSQYGNEYLLLLRRNRGGPLVADTGCVPDYSFGYPPFARSWG